MYSLSNITPTVRNLALLNLAILLAQQNVQLAPSLTQLGSLYPLGSAYFHVWQFLTYMFMHSGWGHLFSNMLGLVVFGPMLEQRWGARRFLAFWLLCGIGAGMLYQGIGVYESRKLESAYADYKASPNAYDYDRFMKESGFQEAADKQAAQALDRNPHDPGLLQELTARVEDAYKVLHTQPVGGMLGASGALFGLMVAFAYLFPNTELFILLIPFPIKAKYLVFFYSLYELYKGVYQTPGDNVAHFAHLSGALVGFIIVRYWERNRSEFY